MKEIKKIIPYFILVGYLLIGFTPYFGAIDKIAPQFVLLSILNLTSLIFLFSQLEVYKEKVDKSLLNILNLLFISSTIFALPSYFNAINVSEFFIELSRLITYLIAFFILLTFLKIIGKRNMQYLILIVCFIHLIEVILVLAKFLELNSLTNTVSRKIKLRVFTGNINITAFSIILKLPFLIYLVNHNFRRYFSLLFFIPISFSTLFLLGSRGANYTSLLLVLALLISLFFKEKIFKKRVVFFVTTGFSLAVAINSVFFSSESKLNFVSRSQNLNNNSTQQRLNFIDYSIDMIIKHPFLGIGLGNWKIKSIEYDSKKMTNYTVPYRPHNDILEIFSERGIFSGILYFAIILIVIIKSLRNLFLNSPIKFNRQLVFTLLLSLLIFLIDSILNFPYSRPIQQVYVLFILSSLSVFNNLKSIYTNHRLPTKTIFFLFLLITTGTGLFNYKIFKSYVEQNFLTLANNGKIDYYNLKSLRKVNVDFPSISATTIPIKHLVANLMLSEKGYNLDEVKNLVELGKNDNPYIGLYEMLKARTLLDENKLDSAYFYVKKAFYERIPNHSNHYEYFFKFASLRKDTVEMKKARQFFSDLNLNNKQDFNERYLKAMASVNSLGEIDKKIIDSVLFNKTSKNKDFQYFNALKNVIGLDNSLIEKGVKASNEAVELFNNEEYQKAAEKFLLATSFIPNEVSYYENAANCYMKLGFNKLGIEILEDLLTNINPQNGKSEYLLSIMYVDENQKEKGCEYLSISINKGFNVPDIVRRSLCN